MLAVFALGLALTQSLPTFDHALLIGPMPSGGRTPCPVDAVGYQLAKGTLIAPKAGDKVALPSGTERTWKEAEPGKDGWFADRALEGGYAFLVVEAPKDETLVLDASGHSMVYVNGVPRGGDVYSAGYVQIPVHLKKGRNEFLFSVGRGRFRASFAKLDGPVSLRQADATLPDYCVGEDSPLLASVVVMNGSDKTFNGRIRCRVGDIVGAWSPVHVTSTTVYKGQFELPLPQLIDGSKVSVTVELAGQTEDKPISKQEFQIDVKGPGQTFKRTFRSSIDGSVQYYAVQPSSQPGAKALVLSLHGAGVEASGQAGSYGQKAWCNIVCPTNGRPYGFDWEDWGRVEALDTLRDAEKLLKPDPDRIYLTGHSMGGHGTWSIGLNTPDHWAAIAPCAAWISFWSYAGAADWTNPDPVETLLRRAANASDTLKMIGNTKSYGIFIQHGAADDTVPVTEAREMRKRLAEFHHDFDWHEEPGAGHWFDTDPEPGANCQDYAPLFAFMARHRLPQGLEARHIDFTTVSPSVCAKDQFVTVMTQEHSLEPSHLLLDAWPDGTQINGTTTNVKVIAFDTKAIGSPKSIAIQLDGDTVKADASVPAPLILEKVDGHWKLLSDLSVLDHMKVPPANGPFKTAFGNHAVLVYGTHGDKALANWSYDKARYDAETWSYRGNGAWTVVSDAEFAALYSRESVNVVLYGNPSCNEAFKVLGMGHVVFDGKGLAIGSWKKSGSYGVLACMRPDSRARIVGVIGGTDLSGCRTVERLSYFLAGVHYPDVTVFSPEALTQASKGVVAAGFFGPDWKIESGDFAFRG